ncbi:Peptidyl-prolyl cis-trans isomerase pin4 [Marasmius crinis-equi]|uniref:Peptidyl-prolyl cis-trans isomerase pin4 n=1 Tax=Marasmius crinis-equi TaxID=585013 RepID=A0ABR3FSB9_9AGAR
MTNSPPDISTLSISSQQRLHEPYDFEGGANRQYHFATSPGIPIQSQYNPLTTGQSPLKNKQPVRGSLPTQWLDNASDNRSLSPQNNSDFSSAGGSPPMGHLPPPIPSTTTPSHVSDDEVIPTAIVIKNIPFNVKRETLLDIIASLAIPTPYAFNYHLDQQGAFRGLAFANFRQAVDADAVVAALNGFDVQGRKLRVEYKKVLQASEKERIEREKALRRMRSMQLEKEHANVGPVTSPGGYEDYGTVISTPFTPQRSFSSGSYHQQQQYSPPHPSTMPPPFSLQNAPPAPPQAPLSPAPSSDKGSTNELDLNDPSTLEIYSRILLFKDDRMRDELAFSRTLSPKQRRVVHLIAQKLGVYHYSCGEGDERYAVVTRIDPNRQQQQPARQPTLSRAPSAYLNPSPSQVAPPASLRVKKSMPDLKTLHSQAPRLTTRASNGNIREGYATIASPSRRTVSGFGSLFSNGSAFSGGSVPPVPSLPSGLQNGGGSGSGHESPGGVVRQPRGPGVTGFTRRDSRVGLSEGQSRGVLDARTYEPLEI